MKAKQLLVLRNNDGRAIEEYDVTDYTGAQELQARFLLSRAYNLYNGEGYFDLVEVENGQRRRINCLDIPM